MPIVLHNLVERDNEKFNIDNTNMANVNNEYEENTLSAEGISLGLAGGDPNSTLGEFKGIPMDLHSGSSMMGDEGPDGTLDADEIKIVDPAAAGEVYGSGNDVEMEEDAGGVNHGDSEDFSKDEVDWSNFSLGMQIPGSGGADGDGYTSFGDKKLQGVVKEEAVVKSESSLSEAPASSSAVGQSLNVNFKTVIGTYKIFVSNLPPGMTNEKLHEMFIEYGTVLNCEVFQQKNYAFVHMDSEAAGNKAVKELNGKFLAGMKIRVQRSTSFPIGKAAGTQEVGCFKLYLTHLNDGVTKEFVTGLLEKFGRIVEIEIYKNNSAFVHMEEESAARNAIKELHGKYIPETGKRVNVTESSHPEGPSIPTITLHVKNIGPQVTAEKVRSLFQPYGLVVKCIILDPQIDALRKAVLHLEQLGDIRSAIKDLTDFELDGLKLHVEPVFEDKSVPQVQKQSPKKGLLHTPHQGFGAPPGLVQPMHFGYPSQPSSVRGMGMGRGRPPHPFRGMGIGRGVVPNQPPTISGLSMACGAPLMNRGGPRYRGGAVQGGRGSGGYYPPLNRGYQLVPMPSQEEVYLASRGRGFGLRGGKGRGQGGFFGRQASGGPPKRAYQNSRFDQDSYDFDEYYQDPKAATSREHLTAFEDPSNPYQEDEQFISGYAREDYQTMELPLGEREYQPPQKKSRGKPPNYMNASNRPPPLMGFDFASEAHQEEPIAQVPYQPQQYPELNLPLGVSEYYSKENNQQRNKTPNSRFQSYQQQPRFQQFTHQQKQIAGVQQHPSAFSDAKYFAGDQIPTTSTNHSNFDGGLAAYPANYYAGVEDFTFNAVPFDYNSVKRGRGRGGRGRGSGRGGGAIGKQLQIQTEFPPGVNPADYPDLKPGSKVYVNSNGKVMVRGARGGQPGKSKRGNPRHPGLGSKVAGSGEASSSIVSGANQQPVAGPSTSYSRNVTGGAFGGAKKFKSKEQIKEENQEYSEWLQQKSWLYHAIPGIVKPASK